VQGDGNVRLFSSVNKTRDDDFTVIQSEKIGDIWPRQRIPKWRATVGEDGRYSFAASL
jgi:hypothetical protein